VATANVLHDTTRYIFGLAAVLGGAAGLVAVAAAVRGWYRRTLGRRRDRYARLARLGTGAQLSFFVAVLGEPPAIRRTIVKDDYLELVDRDDERFYMLGVPVDEDDLTREVRSPRAFTECFFVDRDYYVQTISDQDETVLAYSVTTRDRRFKPIFEAPQVYGWRERRRIRRRIGQNPTPLFRVRLGHTRFADRDPTDPDEFAGPHLLVSVGVRTFRYSELAYFGNPGHYQTYVFTASDPAGEAPVGQVAGVQEEINANEWPHPERADTEPGWDSLLVTQSFRRETAITTITVTASELWEKNFPSTYGPHGNEVRTLP
jgi:hypothetical protein